MSADVSDEDIELVLVFTVGGQAVLEEGDEIVWASDDDDDFPVEFGNLFLTEEDALRILRYLVKEDVISEAEAPTVEIEIESFEGDPIENTQPERSH